MKNTTKGIFCILIASFGFATMNIAVRAAGIIPTFQKTLFRNLIAFLISFVCLLAKHPKIDKTPKDLAILLLRSVFGTLGMICNFYAIDHLLISDASMLNKLSPFFTIILSLIFLKEKISLRQVCYILGAFVGMLFIVKPSKGMISMPALIGVLGGLGAGSAYTAVRALGKRGMCSEEIVFGFSLFSLLFCIPFVISEHVPLSISQCLILLIGSLGATLGQFGLTNAYRFAPSKDISIYDYSNVLFTAIFAFLFFGETPDSWSILGYLIIFIMALLMFLYTKKQKSKI